MKIIIILLDLYGFGLRIENGKIAKSIKKGRNAKFIPCQVP